MKKEYTQSEMEQILRNDAEIPESVDRRMKETYAKLGLVESTGSADNSNKKETGSPQSPQAQTQNMGFCRGCSCCDCRSRSYRVRGCQGTECDGQRRKRKSSAAGERGADEERSSQDRSDCRICPGGICLS